MCHRLTFSALELVREMSLQLELVRELSLQPDLASAPWRDSSPWLPDSTWRSQPVRLAEACCCCTGQAAKSSTGPVSGLSRVCAVQSAVEHEFASDLARAFSAEQVKVFDIHSERVHSLAIHVTADSEHVGPVGIVAVAELGLGRWRLLISHSM